MAREFYCEVMGQVFGPLEPADLRRMAKAGEIAPRDKIRRGENGQWVEAAKVKGLFDERSSAPPDNVAAEPPILPPPPPPRRPPAPPPVVAFQTAPPPAAQAVTNAVPLQAVPYTTPTAVQVNVNTSKAAHSLGIGSVILGTLSILTICVPFIGLPLSAIGLCLGIAGLTTAAIRKGSGIGFSIAGTAVSGLVLLPGGLFWYSVGSAVSSVSKELSDASASARATNQLPLEASEQPAAAESLAQRPRQPSPQTARGTDKSANEQATAQQSTDATAPTEAWADARSGVRQGDIEVRITSARVDYVALTDIGSDRGSSKDKLLSIALAIKNTSATKKIEYEGWSGTDDFLPRNAAVLRDNFGNAYKRVGFGFTTRVVGQISNESIYPGKAVSDVLVFEPPIGALDYLHLELPAGAFDGTGRLRLEIPKNMIEGSAD